MPNGDEPLKRRAIILSLVLLIAAASGAAAQQPVISPPPSEHGEFFARTDFHLNAAWLGLMSNRTSGPTPDQRFDWDTFWGGSLDLVDYVKGRVGFIIDYEAVLGNEYQPFDPNQGNYTLEASTSARLGPNTELVAIFHHVSRHLSDRAKVRTPVAYNELGGRLLRRASWKSATLDIDAEAGAVVEHAYVDYTSLADLHLLARMPLSERVGLFAHAAGHLVGVDQSVANRSETLTGGLIEAGFRVKGKGGTMEFFAGFEKRIDADPLDRQPQHWALAGFRLLSR
jgi:hypothetical protein